MSQRAWPPIVILAGVTMPLLRHQRHNVLGWTSMASAANFVLTCMGASSHELHDLQGLR